MHAKVCVFHIFVYLRLSRAINVWDAIKGPRQRYRPACVRRSVLDILFIA
jgi:hypothetical protein